MVFTFWPFIVIGLCMRLLPRDLWQHRDSSHFLPSSYYQRMKTIESSHFFSKFSCYTTSTLCTVNSSSCFATFPVYNRTSVIIVQLNKAGPSVDLKRGVFRNLSWTRLQCGYEVYTWKHMFINSGRILEYRQRGYGISGSYAPFWLCNYVLCSRPQA